MEMTLKMGAFEALDENEMLAVDGGSIVVVCAAAFVVGYAVGYTCGYVYNLGYQNGYYSTMG